MSPPSQLIDTNQIAASKLHELPFLRGLSCEGADALGNPIQTIVSELSFAADAVVREQTYPDLRVVENQEWSISWEGSLSADNPFVHIDGPPIRKGVVARDGTTTMLEDANSSFCSVGVQPYDIASMVGCDPLLNDSQCGVGETCYRHPETPIVVSNGICIASEMVDAVADSCRDFLVSRRRYTVQSSSKAELSLMERRRVLKTSPLDGCESAMQCETMADREPRLSTDAHPNEDNPEPPDRDFSWACEADPSRAPGVNRCVMSCESSADCELGFSCSGLRCVEGPLPPAECVKAVQRYQLLVGDAFAVVGVDNGFLHSVIADPDTGECVLPADSHVLNVGRLPLRPPPCDDDGDFTTGPNPCSTTIEHSENYFPYVVDENGVCAVADAALRVRQAAAVRFSNPALTFHMVDTETKGDLVCRNDQLGEGPAYATVFAGYQLILDIGGGFLPKIVPNLEASLPVTIKQGPAGRLCVLDQGDASSITRGRVFRINPAAPAGFDLTTIL